MNKLVHVLLVEDDEFEIKAIKRAFATHKIANPIVLAHDGIEALEILRGESPTKLPTPYIILLDLNMPRMNGIEFLAALRKDPVHASAVVFVLTTSSADEDRLAAYREHVAGYIVKSQVGPDFIRMVTMLEAYWRVVELP